MDAPDLTTSETGALIQELQERGAEGVNLAPFCEEEDLIAECKARDIEVYNSDVDGPLLKNASEEDIAERVDELGCYGILTDEQERDHLAELIVEGRTNDALDALWRMAPGGMAPSTVKGIVACRQTETLRGMLS